ncbi:glycogen/starch/alpha-glucan phosphorylase [Desulfurispirillum indicum S5]|uniref:Alpha-1,4 glucan phosphorylase n=1 Tax=Desulfurispirillum indicum (strain ATCC BAA-1389 / DSM 22839 / S5) TaxID=653733 RepID=E6W621_DESIS|nr:glycogen/starch/alpha-glucan phosphorylase [Desulfurispirillum indicum]ADU64960.1 glycogen/starch/alpha-glucan phosphorylase [Desulfurispirillum indicum S5]
MPSRPVSTYKPLCQSDDKDSLKNDIQRHVISSLGNDYDPPRPYPYYKALAYAVRDRMVDRWIYTQRRYHESKAKRVYYLSLEFLPGRFLKNNIYNLNMDQCSRQAVAEFGFDLEDLSELEWDAGLGNGGLGRLASCFLDSMAALQIPGHGYGIRYDYGIFFQTLSNGHQIEKCDNWLRNGNPWEFERPENLYEVQFGGHTEAYQDENGKTSFRWVGTDNIMAMACDTLIPGYDNGHVINMRLWAAKSSREFNLEFFNMGNYVGAVEDRIHSETISKVLYPNDSVDQGRELRLRQQYFFVSATFQDILRRHKKHIACWSEFPDHVAVQLNDTHPSIAVAEFMRLLIDQEHLEWNEAWDVCVRTFAYTNHTLLPEALETWPAALLGRVLPRHMEIILEINRHFLAKVRQHFPGRDDLLEKLSIIQEHPERRVRMAHLAIVGSHTVNGVSALHSRLLQERVFPEFVELFPGKIRNVTNGITPRRWLLQANPGLAALISQHIGTGWITHLDEMKKLAPMVDDPAFREAWRKVKKENKQRLLRYVLRKTGINIDESSLFDVQVKRIHEYKRQLLNIIYVISLYNRLRKDPSSVTVPRTVFFGGKAAPSYVAAKLVIKLINSVAEVVNNDQSIDNKLKIIFLSNYCVSQAEKIIPAADLSEQISTAGMEASGTGNMKFALNGALTIGTLDGANVEIMEEVGRDNIFIFGLKAEEVAEKRRSGHNPWDCYHQNPALRETLDMIRDNFFNPEEPGIFQPLLHSLLEGGDHYMLLADYADYAATQEAVDKLYLDQDEWTRRSIINSINMGKFSSDRSIGDYARDIWKVEPLSRADFNGNCPLPGEDA